MIALTEVLPKIRIFDVKEVVFAPKGYSCFSANLSKGRGVLLYVKHSIAAVDIEQNRNFEESTWCKINLSGGDNIIIGCVYRSPNFARKNNLYLFDTLRDISGGNPSYLLILGDFILNILVQTTQVLKKMKLTFQHSS